MVKIDIISGFLGAGKTTLIKKLLKDIQKQEKILIVENEIGEVNIDAQELQEIEASVKEITQGCICCTLASSLTALVETIEKEGSVNRIIIEPTGMATLSAVLDSLKYIDKNSIEMNLIITLLDVIELEIFAGNFGTFFTDQILNCKLLVLSKVDKATPSDIEFAKYYVKEINPQVPIIESGSDDLDIRVLEELIDHRQINTNQDTPTHRHQDCFDGFENFTINPKVIHSEDELNMFNEKIRAKNYGNIVRMKGYLDYDENFSYKIDYVLGQFNVVKVPRKSDNLIVIIGKDLEMVKLKEDFEGTN